MKAASRFLSGTISEFDFVGGFGLIDADDGGLVFFNSTNLNAGEAAMVDIGSRVQFKSHEDRFGPHADFVRLGEQYAD
jgi:cold shock CspA family protein